MIHDISEIGNPDAWEEIDEATKTERLDAVIAFANKGGV